MLRVLARHPSVRGWPNCLIFLDSGEGERVCVLKRYMYFRGYDYRRPDGEEQAEGAQIGNAAAVVFQA